MARIVIELTNRCNLSCQHCFTGRHGGSDDLPVSILEKVLAEAHDLGFDDITFTGGDPTLHRQFSQVLNLTSQAGYRFGFVTNGWNFAVVYPILRPYRDRLETIFNADRSAVGRPSSTLVRGQRDESHHTAPQPARVGDGVPKCRDR